MRKLIILWICLAFAAGLFVSCSRRENVSGGPTVNSAVLSGSHDADAANASDPSGSPADASDPSGSGEDTPENMLDFAMRVPADTVLRARITGSPGHYVFCYAHPKVPAGLHFTVSLRVYKDEGDGDLLLSSYDSDGTWLADPAQYDPSARDVEQPIEIAGSLEDKYVLVSAKCFGDGIPTFSAAAIHDYDGIVSSGFESVFAWDR